MHLHKDNKGGLSPHLNINPHLNRNRREGSIALTINNKIPQLQISKEEFTVSLDFLSSSVIHRQRSVTGHVTIQTVATTVG
eukprot:8764557-Ditylum_brightwellii.AAC.1